MSAAVGRGDLAGEDGDRLAVGARVVERHGVLALGEDRAGDAVGDGHQRILPSAQRGDRLLDAPGARLRVVRAGDLEGVPALVRVRELVERRLRGGVAHRARRPGSGGLDDLARRRVELELDVDLLAAADARRAAMLRAHADHVRAAQHRDRVAVRVAVDRHVDRRALAGAERLDRLRRDLEAHRGLAFLQDGRPKAHVPNHSRDGPRDGTVARMQVVWSPDTRLHEPKGEVWVGVPTPGDEVPPSGSTSSWLRSTGTGFELVEASAHDDAVLAAVHDPGLLRHLETVHDEWMRSGIPELVGQDRVVPYMFATEAMLDGLPGRLPGRRARPGGPVRASTR